MSNRAFAVGWAIVKEKVKKLPDQDFQEREGITTPPIRAHLNQAIGQAVKTGKNPYHFNKPQRLERPYHKDGQDGETEDLDLQRPRPFVGHGYSTNSPDINQLMRTRMNERMNRIHLDSDIADPSQHERGGFNE